MYRHVYTSGIYLSLPERTGLEIRTMFKLSTFSDCSQLGYYIGQNCHGAVNAFKQRVNGVMAWQFNTSIRGSMTHHATWEAAEKQLRDAVKAGLV